MSPGTSNGSENLLAWTNVGRTNSVQIKTHQLYHGQQVFGRVKCANNIDLIKELSIEPVLVSYDKPDTEFATSSLLTQPTLIENTTTFVQANRSSVTFYWNGISDKTGPLTYQCSIHKSGNDKSEGHWFNNSRRNMCSLQNLHLSDDEVYSLDVKGQNAAHTTSNTVKMPMLVYSKRPTDTGILLRNLMQFGDT